MLGLADFILQRLVPKSFTLLCSPNFNPLSNAQNYQVCMALCLSLTDTKLLKEIAGLHFACFKHFHSMFLQKISSEYTMKSQFKKDYIDNIQSSEAKFRCFLKVLSQSDEVW